MNEYRLHAGVYLSPTPAGAYYAVSTQGNETARLFLFKLMSQDETPESSLDLFRQWLPSTSDGQILELLYRMQQLGWVQGERNSRDGPRGSLERLLPDLLKQLTSSDKVLLADNSGFYVCNLGYPHETAEELSALSADIGALYDRHKGLLAGNLGVKSEAWAIVDAAGSSQIGIWPLHIRSIRFSLVITGLSLLNQPAFADLIWALARRYAQVPENIDQVGT